MNAQNDYTSGIDRWMTNILKIPGYGPYLFSTASSRYMFLSNGDSKVAGSSFISGIWRDQVLNKIGLTNFSTDALLTSLPVPATDQSLLNTVTDIDNSRFKLKVFRNNDNINFESSEIVDLIEVYTTTGVKVRSMKVNDFNGKIQIKERTNNVLLIRATLKNKSTIHKLIID